MNKIKDCPFCGEPFFLQEITDNGIELRHNSNECPLDGFLGWFENEQEALSSKWFIRAEDIKMTQIKFNYADCKIYADRLRGHCNTSGPWWATLLRFVPMFDEITFLREKMQALIDLHVESGFASSSDSKFDEIATELKAEGHIDAI